MEVDALRAYGDFDTYDCMNLVEGVSLSQTLLHVLDHKSNLKDYDISTVQHMDDPSW